MKNYKRILAVICIFALALACFDLSVFADDGYTVTFSNNNTQVTVELGNATGDEVDILTDETLKVKANGKFPAETSTGAEVLSFGSWSKGLVAANNPPPLETWGITACRPRPRLSPFSAATG